MIYELIQPNQKHNSENDLENDLNNWIQEDSICFDVEINQSELYNIDNKIERNCIRASHSRFHSQIMSLLGWWRSSLRTEINQLRYLNKSDFIFKDGFYYYDTQICEFVCTIEQSTNSRPTLYVETINYKPISKTCYNGRTYRIRLTESKLRKIIRETIREMLYRA